MEAVSSSATVGEGARPYTSKIVRAAVRKPRCLWRLVDRCRRITGRDRYYVITVYTYNDEYRARVLPSHECSGSQEVANGG